MNKLAPLCTITLLSGLLVTTAHAKQFVAADDSLATELCMAIASNHSLSLRKTMAEHHVSTNVMQNRLACNGQSTTKFASIHRLNNTAKLLRLDLTTHTEIRDLSASTTQADTFVVSGSK
ncbi:MULTISPECIES: DUF3718 domain-containing protein [Pseudoalteromonas]|uniref:DUF3718 domain-containing protein n=1 Tax=Pseudoalteromonas amylolytica TaxID=1859457 RepID=A0A1S1MZ64_9GAMM|nr:MULTISPECIES: DUF3718 domain-containing protein [Pseudoalteromonas]MCF6434076.1 DUF3718 domain-containing protein [Pseudoalteromonas sp. MMG022]OHU88014.1 hypothetical protein BFC16_11510 [Pseudoalteromonas sp. JW3]OHU91454.1 hypothetical protein BET10_11630 [Pseudoalteromonas amylolytica]